MIKKLATSMLIAISVLFSVSLSADTANAHSGMKLADLLQNLSDKGYDKIQDVELEDGVLSVEGIDKKGALFQLHVDPKTGKIIKQAETTIPKYSMIDVVKKIEDKGDLQIVEVEFDEGIYKVKAKTANDEHKELHIDPMAGETKTDTE